MFDQKVSVCSLAVLMILKNKGWKKVKKMVTRYSKEVMKLSFVILGGDIVQFC